MTNGHIDNREWTWIYISSGLLILLTLIPYLVAYVVAEPGFRFMGLLVNPLDGNTYLAKMRQGASGDWLFHLSYTPEPHRQAFIFTFYIFLGHVSGWLAMPEALVFHAARVVGSLFMLLMLYMFIAVWTDNLLQRRITWGLAAVGSGFGWLAAGAGNITPDLNMPEAFLTYAAYTNAHFPWAIALITYIAYSLSRAMLDEGQGLPGFDTPTLGLVVASVVLVAIQPFGLLPLGIGVGVYLAWRWWRERHFPLRAFRWAAIVPIVGLPQSIYLLWVVSEANPIFHAWNLQNVTSSPPPLDYLIAFGPLLALALVAVWKTWPVLKNGESDSDVLLLGWLIANMLLLYAPLRFQRRLAIGLIIPLALYAGRGVVRVILPEVKRRWRPLVITAVFVASTPSTVMALTLPLYGTVTLDQRLYVNETELAGLDWLKQHTSPDDVVLASPSYSVFIPGYSGARVVYGHDFETVRAAEREAAAMAFYGGSKCELPAQEGVDFVVYGPREAAIGDSCVTSGTPVFSSDGIRIYEAGD